MTREPRKRRGRCPGKRYEIRAWAPSARARKRPGEIHVRSYWFCTDDPHYAAIELYRLRAEQRASGAYRSFRYEVLDHGAGGRHALAEVVTYDELVRRARSLVASDRARRRRRRRSSAFSS